MTNIKLKMDVQRCKGCGLCVQVCPKNCLQMSGELNETGNYYVKHLDQDKCNGCGLCFRMCPDMVITITKSEKKQGRKIQEIVDTKTKKTKTVLK